MRTIHAILALAALAASAPACSPIQGERFWWNDQEQSKLEPTYELPEWPAETPLPAGETPFVDKKFKPDEVERARAQERRQISAGIPRCGVPDPLANPVPVKVAQWGGEDAAPAAGSATANIGADLPLTDAAPLTETAPAAGEAAPAPAPQGND